MDKQEIKFKNKIAPDDYMRLRRAADWNEISRRQAKAGLKNSVCALSAVCGGKTVGMARVVGDGGYVALIVDVVVLPEYRGRGIGTKLMELLMERVCDTVRDGEGIMAQLMAARGREGFYGRFGFTARPSGSLGSGMSQWIEVSR